jgi:C1A family cysteine protease
MVMQNQKSCGSCWAFASAALVESQVLLAEDQVTDLSEQQLNE